MTGAKYGVCAGLIVCLIVNAIASQFMAGHPIENDAILRTYGVIMVVFVIIGILLNDVFD